MAVLAGISFLLLCIALGLYFYEANKVRTWTEEQCLVTDVQQRKDLRWVPETCARYDSDGYCRSWTGGYYKTVYWYEMTIEVEMAHRTCLLSQRSGEREDRPPSAPPIGRHDPCWGNTDRGETCPSKTQWRAPNLTHGRRFLVATLILCPSFLLVCMLLWGASGTCCDDCSSLVVFSSRYPNLRRHRQECPDCDAAETKPCRPPKTRPKRFEPRKTGR